MNLNNLLKLAGNLDKQGKYKTSDQIFKMVSAQSDDFDLSKDPLGISSIGDVPTEIRIPFTEIQEKFERGEISESEFLRAFEEMMREALKSPYSNDRQIDYTQSTLSSSGVETFGEDRAFVAAAAEFSDDVSVDWINDLQEEAIPVLEQAGLSPDDEFEAGDMLLDLAQGNALGDLTINGVIRQITPFEDFYDFYQDYLQSRIPEMISMIEEAASRSPYNKDIQVSESEIATLLEESNANMSNINSVLETILVRLLVSKVR